MLNPYCDRLLHCVPAIDEVGFDGALRSVAPADVYSMDFRHTFSASSMVWPNAMS